MEREATDKWPTMSTLRWKEASVPTRKFPPILRSLLKDTSSRAEMVLLARWKSPMETSPSTVREPAMVQLPPTIRALFTYWSPSTVTLPPTVRFPPTPTFCRKVELPPTMRVSPITMFPVTSWFFTVSWLKLLDPVPLVEALM